MAKKAARTKQTVPPNDATPPAGEQGGNGGRPKVRRGGSRKSNGGRPKGSKNVQRDVVAVEVARCKRCGSTNRTKYAQVNNEIQFAPGQNSQGRFTHIVARSTRCTDCGQARRDLYYYNDPGKSNEELREKINDETD